MRKKTLSNEQKLYKIARKAKYKPYMVIETNQGIPTSYIGKFKKIYKDIKGFNEYNGIIISDVVDLLNDKRNDKRTINYNKKAFHIAIKHIKSYGFYTKQQFIKKYMPDLL